MKLSPNLLTLQQAQAEGYGTINSIKKQILRGVVKAFKVGFIWVVHRRELEKMVVRRKRWLVNKGRKLK